MHAEVIKAPAVVPRAHDRRPDLRILFAGYAPVHFICFRPLYDRLSLLPGVQVFVSGGLRSKTENGHQYDEQAMYRRFKLPEGTVLSVEEIQQRDFDVLFAAHTRLILPRNVRKKIQIFHGISFRNKAVRPENMQCDHYFVVGPYMRRRFLEAGLLPANDERAVRVGFMKTDRLLNGTLDRPRLLAEFGFSGERPVLLYAPTGARQNSLEIMGEKVIAQITASGRYDLIVKLHDHPKNTDIDWSARLARFEDAHCRIACEPDIIPLLHLSDLLISDASSVSNEYTLLDRPLIFLNTPELIEHARVANNSMLDLATWGRKAGVVVERVEEIEGALRFSMEYPSANSEVRRAMAEDFFYNPGTATETAMRWLQQHVLDTRPPMAKPMMGLR